MTNTTADQPGTVALEPPSTVLNPQTVTTSSGGGQPSISEPEDKSIAGVLEAELASIKESDAKSEQEAKDKAEQAAKGAKEKLSADDKDEKAEKKAEKVEKQEPEKAEAAEDKNKTAEGDAKAAKGEAEKPADGQEGAVRRQSEGRQYAEPPARFLPESRAKWQNVPNEVKADFHRVSQEYEAEIQRSKAVSERYEPIRQFDEIARSNGRELKDSLAKVVQIENALAQNPIAGLEMIMREIGPRKADGSQLSLYEVAQAIAKQTPQQYQSTMGRFTGQQAQPRQQQASPEVVALKTELGELKSMLMTQQASPIIERFAAQHDDYRTLEPQIAEILKSKVIEKIYGTGLSPEQKLAEAYRMAGGRGPASRSDLQQEAPGHSSAETVPSKDAGTKSIRGAPSDGTDVPVEEDTSDLREMLRKDFRRLTA